MYVINLKSTNKKIANRILLIDDRTVDIIFKDIQTS